MSYITKYLLETKREDIIASLKKSKDSPLDFNNVSNAKIGNFIESGQKDGYIEGVIVVKRAYDDFEYDIDENYEIKREKNEISVYDEVIFTIFPDLKIVSFSSKDGAIFFGMEVLSRIIFKDGGKLFGLTFYPQMVLDSKKRGNFKNVWFNGVRFEGNIGYTGQFGTEIDEDAYFMDSPEKRDGLGIVFLSKTGKDIKIAIYKQGTLLRHTKMKDVREDLKLEKEMILTFIPYSNYGEKVPDKSSDQFISLTDFMKPDILK